MRFLFLAIVYASLLVGCVRPGQGHIYNVLDYGAQGDSCCLDTKPIQEAIDRCSENGGGTVLVPPGNYITGTLFLKSNVRFEVSVGATIIGSSDLSDYYEHKWGHNGDRQPYHLILAYKAHNIEICGGGTIDGNGPAFWEDFEPDSLPQWIMPKDLKISPMMEVEKCKDFRIRDVTLKTGGGWTLHLYDSDQVQVRGVKILNNIYSPNGDGIDITGSWDVVISDCIIKTCDDAICVKTTVDSREAKRIVVSNCVIECLCAALKIGNESFRDISQVTFNNCVIYGSSRAIGIYAESAGTVSDVLVNNIITDTKVPLLYNRPIHLSLYLPKPGAGNRNGDWMHLDQKQWDYQGREPRMKNITISNFTATTEGRILITAEDGRFIENLTLSNINMEYPWIENPLTYVDEVTSSQFAPVKHQAKTATAALVLENIKNLKLSGLSITWPETSQVPEEWQFKKKLANGTLKPFYPSYNKAVEVDFSAIYGRGLVGGFIQTIGLTATSTSIEPMDIRESSIDLRR